MNRKRTAAGATGMILAGIFFFGGCGKSPERGAQAPELVQGKHVTTLHEESIPDEIEVAGTVVAATTAQVAARTMGTATQVAAREGDRVRQGQLLVQLDDRELAARRAAARAALEETSAGREEAARAVAAARAQADVAAKTHARFVYLRDQKSVSAQEFDEAEARMNTAQASLERAQASLRHAEAAHARAESEVRAADAVAGYTRVVAPLSGVVARRMVDAGTMVTPGTPLFVVEDGSRYRLQVSVPAEVGGVVRGSAARVTLDAQPGKEFQGKVVELEAGADPASHTVQARIELPVDTGLRSGLFGRAWFRRGERKTLLAPRGAIVERGQLRGVYVLGPDGLAQWRIVTLGKGRGERVEILSGLNDGDRIVANPGEVPLDGKKIAAGGAAGEAGR